MKPLVAVIDEFDRDPGAVSTGFGKFDQCLANFNSHSLESLEQNILLDRIDSKYLLNFEEITHLLESIKTDYSVLQIAELRSLRYQNTYFDTEKLLFFNQHRRGKLNRHKVRLRSYLDSRSDYLEIKFKTNKNRTIKSRLEVAGSRDFDIADHRDFLADNNIDGSLLLKPKLSNEYSRISLFNASRSEKLTIDIDLTSSRNDGSETTRVALLGLGVIELKQQKLDRKSPAYKLIKSLGKRPTGFSKYCLGMSMCAEYKAIPNFRFNRFKPALRRTNKYSSSC